MIDGLRLGAYVLAADPTWVRSSLARYYEHLDVLVVSLPADGRGWTGAPVAARSVLDTVRELDTRGIVRVHTGSWIRPENPLAAETVQRQESLAAVGDDVDWVLQIDTDEVLPDLDALVRVLHVADQESLHAVEWPMRVLFRRLPAGTYLQVSAADRSDHFEYPGAIAVRPGVHLAHCRKATGDFLRPAVHGDTASYQLARDPEPGEVRRELLASSDAIAHNSWARPPRAVRRKVSSWGHSAGPRTWLYYWLRWLPAPALWPFQRHLHPFDRDLWPRLTTTPADVTAHVLREDR